MAPATTPVTAPVTRATHTGARGDPDRKGTTSEAPSGSPTGASPALPVGGGGGGPGGSRGGGVPAVPPPAAHRGEGQDQAGQDGHQRDQQGHVHPLLGLPRQVHRERAVVDGRAERGGSRRHPLAKPSMRTGGPRDPPPSTEAFHPAVDALAEDQGDRGLARARVDPQHREVDGRRGLADHVDRRRGGHRRRGQGGGRGQGHRAPARCRVEGQLVDVESGDLTGVRLQGVVARPEGHARRRRARTGRRSGPGGPAPCWSNR